MARRAARKHLRRRTASSVQLEFDFATGSRMAASPPARDWPAQTFTGVAAREDDALFQAAVARIRARWLRPMLAPAPLALLAPVRPLGSSAGMCR